MSKDNEPAQSVICPAKVIQDSLNSIRYECDWIELYILYPSRVGAVVGAAKAYYAAACDTSIRKDEFGQIRERLLNAVRALLAEESEQEAK